MVIPGFKGEVAEDAATRKSHATDASIFEVMPQAVVFPRDAEDVKTLVRFVNNNRHLGLSLTARAAGTDMSGGPLTESISVDFSRHMHTMKHVGYGSAEAEPGVYYRDFEKAVASQGFLMPSYPASKGLCAIGGMVANNSGGEKTLSYGKTADYVKRVHMVCADGEEHVFMPLSEHSLREKMKEDGFEGGVYREMYRLVTDNADLLRSAKPKVSKNSAGYALWDIWDGKTFDLTRLITGSQGTLGLMTRVLFRTVRPKGHSRLLIMFVNKPDMLGKLIPAVLMHRPESFESYDDRTFALGLRFFAFRFAFRFLPEAWMILKNGGLPKLAMLAEFTGDSDHETLRMAEAARQDLARFGIGMRITKSPGDAEKYWAVRRESFSLLRTKVKGRQTAPFIDDIIVAPDKLPEFLPQLDAILAPYADRMTYTVAGHMGDGNFHIIPLMDLKSARSRQIIPELSEKVYSLVIAYGGSITAEHNDGLIRTPYLEQMYGEDVCRLFGETKRIFDPENIFNPGKKVGGDKAYAVRHIKNG